MSTYVIGDIHGQLELVKQMLKLIQIDFEKDQLYLLGDYVDWGPNSIKTLQYIINLQTKSNGNLKCLIGNHDKMMLDVISGGETAYEWKSIWYNNGGRYTHTCYLECSDYMRRKIKKWLQNLPYTVQNLHINNRYFYLCHAAPMINGRDTRDSIWDRSYPYDLSKEIEDALPNTTVVCGHTIVKRFGSFNKEFKCKIYKNSENLIYIDCGAKIYDTDSIGRLACLRLDDLQEFYTGGE